MARAKEATSGKQAFGDADLDSTDVQKNGQPCVIVSGNSENIGRIT